MKRRYWLYTALTVAVFVGAMAWAFSPQAVPVEVASVREGPFQLSVEEDGKTRLRDRYVVTAPLAGHLGRMTLREGDAVVLDEVVARITPAYSPLLDERTSRELAARIEAAQANVRLAHARVARARVAWAQARNEWQRSEQLAQQGFVSPIKRDTDDLNVQAAQKELDAAVEGEQVASHERMQALAARSAWTTRPEQASRSAAEGFAVQAPVSGQVLRVHQSSESPVAMGTALLELGDTRRLEIVADLLTPDALQAQPGALVWIERWGGVGVLQGRVRRVEPAAATKVSALGVEEQRVKVLIDLSSPPEAWSALGDGYRVTVRIVTLSQDAALQVPVTAVFPMPTATSGHDGSPARREPSQMGVFLLKAGRARLVPVVLGGRTAQQAWIREGLAVGDQVIVYPSTAVKDGAKVRVRQV